MVIGWKLSKLDANLASTRYRALFPSLFLRRKGIISKFFSTSSVENIADIDVLVIVKSFTVDDIILSQIAFDKNIPVIFDLCDNIFLDSYNKDKSLKAEDILQSIATFATAIVTPTEPLADIVRKKYGDKLLVHVIPDCISNLSMEEDAYRIIRHARLHQLRDFKKINFFKISQQIHKLAKFLHTTSLQCAIHRLFDRVYRKFKSALVWKQIRLSRAIRRTVPFFINDTTPPFRQVISNSVRNSEQTQIVSCASLLATNNVRRLLWFGNHGARHSGRFGMIDLVDNRLSLERIAREFDVELVVVSNDAEKFQQLIAPLAIPSRFVEWSPARLQEELTGADVVLVPNSCDAFSICKSANRTARALMANRPVVATLTPALRPLDDCIEAGDFYIGIHRYLTDQQLVETHLAIARERCEHLYGQKAIASAWQGVLDAVLTKTEARQPIHTELLLVVNLVQDVEFICPIIAAAKDKGVGAAIWVSASMISRWPYTLATLLQFGVPLHVLEETRDGAVVPRFTNSVRAVLTIADTNLGPHRFAHSITQAANKAGITTGTLQHGFENVGLTYSDELHNIEQIEFDAKHIFLWGDLSLLHPRVSEKTRQKCITVGCPKMAGSVGQALPTVVPTSKPVVGIFENLHWHRYDDAYRQFFLNGAYRLAEDRPDITFVIKPHNAGRWLTTRFKGRLEPPENLLIADPSEDQWKGFTAAGMLPNLSGVITSPSTVALDAARVGLPLAVVAHGMSLDNYAPLYQIQEAAQWKEFVARLFDELGRNSLVEASHRFVARVVLPGDAATRIVNYLSNPGSESAPNDSEKSDSLNHKITFPLGATDDQVF